MSDFFFFTDQDFLNTQSADQAFGYNDSGVESGKDRFLVTSLHTATSDANAYAICKGRIFVQRILSTPSGEPVLVNIILKPSVYSIQTHPRVKFFIYRGVREDSLIGSSTQLSRDNTLTDHLYTSEPPKNSPKGTSLLGLDISSSAIGNLEPLEKVFNAYSGFTPPEVEGGWTLGKFHKDFIGFEIIFDTLEYQPPMGFARLDIRASGHFIKVDSLSSTYQSDIFKHQNDKEEVLNYMDPIAFFGNFYSSLTDKLFIMGTTKKDKTTKDDFITPNLTGSAIYTDLIGLSYSSSSTVYRFFNRNAVFFDIRDELNHSYDYQWIYGSYSGNDFSHKALKYYASYPITDTDTPNLINYYDHNGNNGWPVLKLSESEFVLSSNNSKGVLPLALPYDTSKNEFLSDCYLSQGFIDDGEANLPARLAGSEKFISLTRNFDNFTNLDSYTQPINVATPFCIDGSNYLPIAAFIKIHYFRYARQCIKQIDSGGLFSGFKIENPIDAEPSYTLKTRLNPIEYLDHLFIPLAMESKLPTISGATGIYSTIFYDKYFFDLSRSNGRSGMARRGIAKYTLPGHTTPNVSLFAYLFDFQGLNEDQNIFNPYNSSYTPSPNSILSYEAYVATSTPNLTLRRDTVTLSCAGVVQTFLRKDRVDSTNFTDADDGTSFVSITFTNSQWTDILGKINDASKFTPGYNVYLGLEYVNEGTSLDSAPNAGANDYYHWVQYNVVLRGYLLNTTNHTVELNRIDTSVSYYSIRQSYDMTLNANNFPKILAPPDDSVGNNVYEIEETLLSSTSYQESIKCKLNLVRGLGISQLEYTMYCNYFWRNIQQVWTKNDSTKGNTGLQNIMVGSKNINLDATVVEFSQGRTKQFRGLENTEILVYVERGFLHPRSATLLNRRGMYMIFDPNMVSFDRYVEGPVAAHEFGHVLGLCDRYTQVGSAFIKDYYDTSSPPKLVSASFKVNRFYSRSVPIYLPLDYDNEYMTKYRWQHNLMSTRLVVPDSTDLASATDDYPKNVHPSILKEQNYKDIMHDFCPNLISSTNEILNSSSGSYSPKEYNITSIFITSKQVEVILDENIKSGLQTEDSIDNNTYPDNWQLYTDSSNVSHNRFKIGSLLKYADYVFFINGPKPDDGVNEFTYNGTSHTNMFFTGSFVGYKRYDPKNSSDYIDLVSDFGYNYYTSDSDGSINGDMSYRIRDWSGSSPQLSDSLLGNILAHFSPYDPGLPNNLLSSRGLISSSDLVPGAQLIRNNIERGENGPNLSTSILAHISNRFDYLDFQNSVLPVSPGFLIGGTRDNNNPKRKDDGQTIRFTLIADNKSSTRVVLDNYQNFGGDTDLLTTTNQEKIVARAIWSFIYKGDNNIQHLPYIDRCSFDLRSLQDFSPPPGATTIRFILMWNAYINRRVIFRIIDAGTIGITTSETDPFPENVSRVSRAIDRL